MFVLFVMWVMVRIALSFIILCAMTKESESDTINTIIWNVIFILETSGSNK